MTNDKLFVLTFVLVDQDKNNFNNLIKVIKKYLLSIDIKLIKTSLLKNNKASDFFFLMN